VRLDPKIPNNVNRVWFLCITLRLGDQRLSDSLYTNKHYDYPKT